MFGKATVTLSDVTAGNGVVHAIDEVLFASPQTSQLKNDVNKKENLVSIL
jgi:Fasciclin domain